MSDNPYINKLDDGWEITPAGREYLSEVVTDPVGSVYAFTSKLSPVVVGSAMARVSRFSGDLRECLLSEFADNEGRSEELIDRVVGAFGDDSVKQLVTLWISCERVSNLATKALEWPRLGSYLEQSTRYIPFDQKVDGRYKYHVPTELANSYWSGDWSKRDYCEAMDQIFSIYSRMVTKLVEHVRTRRPQGELDRAIWLASTRADALDRVRPVLPVATQSTVAVVASVQTVENLCYHLKSLDYNEAGNLSKAILTAARQVDGVDPYLTRVDMPHRGGKIVEYKHTNQSTLRNLAKELIGSYGPKEKNRRVSLIRYWPAHEAEIAADLAAEMLWSQTDVPLAELQLMVRGLGDSAIDRIFTAYIGDRTSNRRLKPGRVLELVHTEWEIVGDYGTFRDLQRHRMVDSWEWQLLTPNYGYDVPEMIVEAGLEHDFRRCFELSERLHSLLLDHCGPVVAQYATLLGHRMRYRFAMNMREAFHMLELRTGPDGHPGYRAICQEMHRRLGHVYPRLAAAMIHVGQREDDTLGRLDKAELEARRAKRT